MRQTNGEPIKITLHAGSTVKIGTTLPDVYAFCVSEERMEKHGDSEYIISDFDQFASILTETLRRDGYPVEYYHLDKVRYGEYKTTITDLSTLEPVVGMLNSNEAINDYFLKPPRFAEDAEWRIIFMPQEGHSLKDQILVRASKLKSICELYA